MPITLDGSNGITLPNLASDPANPVEGQMYYNTTDAVTKTYSAGEWRNTGIIPVFTSTFDFFGDSSAVSLHRLNNTLTDTGGVHTANIVGNGIFTTTAKFGSHAINLYGTGIYMDIQTLPRIYSVSFWAYAAGSASDSGYLVDFRHDAPANSRGYLYTSPGKTISLSTDSTASNAIGDIYIDSVRLTSTHTFSLNTWTHVVISVSNAASTSQTWDQGLRFGNRSDGTTSGLFGYFDQIRTFNRSLNQGEVSQLYNESERP